MNGCKAGRGNLAPAFLRLGLGLLCAVVLGEEHGNDHIDVSSRSQVFTIMVDYHNEMYHKWHLLYHLMTDCLPFHTLWIIITKNWYRECYTYCTNLIDFQ